MQRTQRRHELRLEHAARQREMAEEIFFLIDEAKREANANVVFQLKSLTHETPDISPPEAVSIGRLRALVAMYYPDALPLLIAYDSSQKHIAGVMQEKISSLLKNPAKDGPMIMKGVVALAVTTSAQKLHPALDKLHSHMVEAVKRYTAAPDVLWNPSSVDRTLP